MPGTLLVPISLFLFHISVCVAWLDSRCMAYGFLPLELPQK